MDLTKAEQNIGVCLLNMKQAESYALGSLPSMGCPIARATILQHLTQCALALNSLELAHMQLERHRSALKILLDGLKET